MSEALTKVPGSQEIERVLLGGDLGKLSPDQRLAYYNNVCKSLGLNPLTRPFDYIVLNGKMQLYAKKDCTDQLRMLHHVSVDKLTHNHDKELGLYIVTAEGHAGDRNDTGTGAVNIKGQTGDGLANAIMKAETKAKRRLTLSICGLGMLDETEIETIHGAKSVSTKEIQGTVEQLKVFADKGVSVIKIGGKKYTIKDLAVDKLLANSEGEDVELEIGEDYGPKGKYEIVTKVLRIGRLDYRNLANDLTPALEASLEAVNGSYDPAKLSGEVEAFLDQNMGKE